jgi:hypothetical protein
MRVRRALTAACERELPGDLMTSASAAPLDPPVGLSQVSGHSRTDLVARTGGVEMYALPHTPMGRLALWLLIPVLLYVVIPVWLLVSDLPQAVSIAIVITIIGLALASLVTSGLAIFREKERSVLVVVLASLTFLIVVAFTVGEFVGGH